MKFYSEVLNLSNILNTKNGIVSVIVGAICSTFSYLFGSDPKVVLFMLILCLAIIFDWSGGIGAAKKDGSYASEYGLQGVLRTFVMVLLPAFGNLLDKAFGTPGVFFFVLWGGIMFHTLTSATANFKRAGWDNWIPAWALDLISSEIEAKLKRAQLRKDAISLYPSEGSKENSTEDESGNK